jgi:hypothetical protein
MKKFLSFLVVSLFLVLAGCQNDLMTNVSADDVEETTVKGTNLLSDIGKEDIKEITIRNTDSGNKQTLDQEKDINILLNVITNVSKMKAVLNMDVSNPGYIILVQLTNNSTKRFDLWMKEGFSKGMLMDISNPDVMYELPEKDVDQLRDIIKN